MKVLHMHFGTSLGQLEVKHYVDSVFVYLTPGRFYYQLVPGPRQSTAPSPLKHEGNVLDVPSDYVDCLYCGKSIHKFVTVGCFRAGCEAFTVTYSVYVGFEKDI